MDAKQKQPENSTPSPADLGPQLPEGMKIWPRKATGIDWSKPLMLDGEPYPYSLTEWPPISEETRLRLLSGKKLMPPRPCSWSTDLHQLESARYIFVWVAGYLVIFQIRYRTHVSA